MSPEPVGASLVFARARRRTVRYTHIPTTEHHVGRHMINTGVFPDVRLRARANTRFAPTFVGGRSPAINDAA
jgi:hypothetical protein